MLGPTFSDLKTILLPYHEPIQRTWLINFSLESILTLKNIYIILGPILSLIVYLFAKFDDALMVGWNMLVVIAWVFALWVMAAMPLLVTSMCPLSLIPPFGIILVGSVAHCYMDDVITLVLESFILALAIECYNIYKRLAIECES